MPAPPLAVVRGLEQPLDQPSVGTGFAIADEFPDFRRTRQESGQVQADAADQRAAIRLRRRFQALGFEFGEHERVNRIAYPAVSIHVRRLGPLDWAKRPQGNGGCGIPGRIAPCGPIANPFPKRRDIGIRERARRGHLQGAGTLDCMDQQALIWPARSDRRSPPPAQQR